MDLDTTIVSWNPFFKNEICFVEKIGMEKETSISKAKMFHLLEHMANQSQVLDDKSNRYGFENNNIQYIVMGVENVTIYTVVY